MIKRTHSVRIDNLSPYSNSVEELRAVLEDIPPGATYDIIHRDRDRAWEGDTYSIEFEWVTETP